MIFEAERVTARKCLRFEDLLIEESPAALPSSEETARVLATAAGQNLENVLPPEDSAAGMFLIRARCLSWRSCSNRLASAPRQPPWFSMAPIPAK